MATVFFWASMLAYASLALAFAMAVFRMVRGPSLPDRIVAIDMISYVTIGFIALTAMVSGRQVYLDVTLALALIAFLAVIAFARYVEQMSRAKTSSGVPDE